MERPRQIVRREILLVAGLLLLAGLGAEILTAYSDSTGDPSAVAFSLVFFAALYGAPALLVRELARRKGWGWPSMLMFFAALGIAEACLIDQAMFSLDYQGYEGWEATRNATLIQALGISGFNAYNFIIGHVIFSFGAPVAVAEGWNPSLANKPWLGRWGISVAILAYAGAAALILSDPESQSGSPAQLITSAVLVVLCVAGAVLLGVRWRTIGQGRASESGRDTSPWVTLVMSTVLALVVGLASETWGGVAWAFTWLGIGVVGFVAYTRVCRWSVAHIAALGGGFLMSRGALAFTYFPLAGDVEPLAKYLHNTIAFLFVLLLVLLAVCPRETRRGRQRV